MKRIKYFLLVAIMTVMAFMFTGCGSKQVDVDLNEYVTINTQGYNLKGNAGYSFNYEKFYEDYNEKITISDEEGLKALGYSPATDAPAEMLADFCISMNLDKTDGLSNGDIVTLTWNCDDEFASEYFNCKLNYSDVEYTVGGLKEVAQFDPFEYLEVSFEGIAPNGTVVLKPDYTRNEVQYISFSADKTGGLRNGDVVTVTAYETGSFDFTEKFCAVLSETTKTYTVEKLEEYATDISQISAESLEKMDKQAQDVFKAHVAKHWAKSETLNSITYIGNYFLKPKEGMNIRDNNYLYLVYKVQASHPETGELVDYYYYTYYKNVTVLSDGTCSIDLADYKTPEVTFYVGRYYYYGYEDLTSLYNDQIVSQIDNYEFTTNIKE